MVEIKPNTYIDIHAHLSDERFDSVREELINKLQDFIVLNAGENKKEDIKVINEYHSHTNILPCIGLHPNEVVKLGEDQLSENMSYLDENISKFFAVSEIGLDYKRKTEDNIALEKRVLEQILSLSEKYGKVCILHSRKSMTDLLDILKSYKIKAILHNFEGNSTQLSAAVDAGFFISVSTGFMKFKKDNLIKKIPLDHLFFETDSPALNADGAPGELNTPLNIVKIMQYFSNLRHISMEELIEKIRSNFINVFRANL
ncbi:MAG: TatD family hydrolase [Candidatus Acidifodinimicrobium sp.]